MDITLLIGNGFDKALGLKTGYHDFYEWLKDQQPDNEYIRLMRKKIKKDEDLWSDFEIGMGLFTNRFVEEDLSDDFNPWKSETDDYLKKYLKSLNTSKSVSKIINSGDNIQRYSDYLQGAILTLKLLNPDLFANAEEITLCHMISLNYTDSLEQIADNMNSMGNSLIKFDSEVLHPHGVLSNGIILGVNDVSQINNEKIQQNENYSNMIIKAAQIKSLYPDIKKKAIDYIERSTIVCLYGVSLGVTDKDWWNLLENWLRKDKRHRLIVFWYSSKNESDMQKELKSIHSVFLDGLQDVDNVRDELEKRIIVYIHNKDSLFSAPHKKIFPLGNGVTLPMIFIEAGSFLMSKTDGENGGNEKEHIAEIKEDFYIGETPVTQKQYEVVLGKNPSKIKGENLPVEQATWHDAMDFCNQLNKKNIAPLGFHFTLPTETQWEYAARGGKKSRGYKYSGSDNIDEVAWYEKNSSNSTHNVATKKPNELGIYDMSGNVWEFCLDNYIEDSRKAKPEFSRNNDESEEARVDRGGAYDCSATRVSVRSKYNPADPRYSIGFRIVLVSNYD